MPKQISDFAEDLFQLGLKAVIINDKKEVLVLRIDPNTENLLKEKKEYWDFPGGRINYGEKDVITALKREVFEEIKSKNLKVLGGPIASTVTKLRFTNYDRDVGLIIIAFHCELSKDKPIELSSEHLEWKWANPAKLKSLMGNKYDDNFLQEIKSFVAR